MQLEIETRDRQLAYEILGTPNEVSSGSFVSVPGGGRLTFEYLTAYKALDIPETLHFIVDVTTNLEVGLLSAWLYEKVRGRTTRIHINRIEVQVEEGEIKRVLLEQIEREE